MPKEKKRSDLNKHYGVNIRYDESRQAYVGWVPEIPEINNISWSRTRVCKGIYTQLNDYLKSHKVAGTLAPEAGLYDLEAHLPGETARLAEAEAARQAEITRVMNSRLETDLELEELNS